MDVVLQPRDALLVVDLQEDFVTGALAVPGATSIVPAVNRYLALFSAAGLPVIASRDWHPPGHVSFRAQGGPWPEHCVAGTAGARFVPGLDLPRDAMQVFKGTTVDREAYSAFDGTGLDARLRGNGAERLFICGLATEYCVLFTVRDARRRGYDVFVLADAIQGIDREAGDAERALAEMRRLGARMLAAGDIVHRNRRPLAAPAAPVPQHG